MSGVNREAGFSLVEATVAAVVLAVGVLGVAASGAAARRLADLGTGRARAAELALGRLALLQAHPCTAAAGSWTLGRDVVNWSVVVTGAARRLDVTASVPEGPRTRTVRVSGAGLCTGDLP